MKLFEQITTILSKGYNALDNNDKWKLIEIQDQLYQEKASKSEVILVKGQEIKWIEAIRTLALKEEKGDDGKKKYTEVQIDSIIYQETATLQTDINVAKFEKEKLEWKIDSLDKYITALRDKINTSIQKWEAQRWESIWTIASDMN